MDPRIEYRDKWLPYRMKSVETLGLCLDHMASWESTPDLKILFDDMLVIEGRANAFTNPAVEAGILHARALLDFIGLKSLSRSPGRLVERSKKSFATDIVIEDYGLTRVSVSEVVSKYLGPPEEAEAALAAPVLLANSFVAHNSMLIPEDPEQVRLLRIAARGVPALMISYFYTPLGLEAPSFRNHRRTRLPSDLMWGRRGS